MRLNYAFHNQSVADPEIQTLQLRVIFRLKIVRPIRLRRCESDDDLKLSVIKNRIKRTGRFLQQQPKVDDILFGYTHAKHISNRVEKDYSLYYRKVHSQKPQREFPDTVDTMTLMTRLIPRHSPQTNMSSSID